MEDYSYLKRMSGVKVTACENRFEVMVDPGVDAKEHELKLMLIEWVKKRRDAQNLREKD